MYIRSTTHLKKRQMSLTSILKKERGRRNIKDWFRHHFSNPGLKEKLDIIVPPKQTHSAYAGEIGTAFDYLVRFNLERINKKTFISKDYWVAELGLEQILSSFESSEEKRISIGYYRDRQVDRVKFKDFLEKEFEQAKKNYKKFVKDGKMTKDLIKSSIFLAKLDVKKRAGITDADLDNIETDKIDELKELCAILPWDKFKADKHCILNPTFGKGSTLVGGADADLIIDNTLIDIKSSKNLKLQREDLNQIISYYLLSIIGGINGKKTPKINRIGIYFARYGHIWQMPLSVYYKPKDYEKLAYEFANLVQDRFLQLVEPNNRQTNRTFTKSADYTIDENDFKCPFCKSKNFIRQGKSSSGKFRYRCKDCNKSFSTTIEKSNSNLSPINYTIDKNDFKCPFCESKDFIQYGKSSSGKFRYKCKDCNKSFSTTIETTALQETIKNLNFDDL